jgi:hypothetical protein
VVLVVVAEEETQPLVALVAMQHIQMELLIQVAQEQMAVEEEQESLETEMLALVQLLVSVAQEAVEAVVPQLVLQQPLQQVAQVASLFITRSNT